MAPYRFACYLCDRSYTRVKTVKDHFALHHSGAIWTPARCIRLVVADQPSVQVASDGSQSLQMLPEIRDFFYVGALTIPQDAFWLADTPGKYLDFNILGVSRQVRGEGLRVLKEQNTWVKLTLRCQTTCSLNVIELTRPSSNGQACLPPPFVDLLHIEPMLSINGEVRRSGGRRRSQVSRTRTVYFIYNRALFLKFVKEICETDQQLLHLTIDVHPGRTTTEAHQSRREMVQLMGQIRVLYPITIQGTLNSTLQAVATTAEHCTQIRVTNARTACQYLAQMFRVADETLEARDYQAAYIYFEMGIWQAERVSVHVQRTNMDPTTNTFYSIQSDLLLGAARCIVGETAHRYSATKPGMDVTFLQRAIDHVHQAFAFSGLLGLQRLAGHLTQGVLHICRARYAINNPARPVFNHIEEYRDATVALYHAVYMQKRVPEAPEAECLLVPLRSAEAKVGRVTTEAEAPTVRWGGIWEGAQALVERWGLQSMLEMSQRLRRIPPST